MKVKSFLIKLLIISLVLAALSPLAIIRMRAAIEKEYRVFINTAVYAVTENWDRKELIKRASMEYLQATSKEKMDELFASYSRLGHMKEYLGAVGTIDANDPSQTVGIYTAEADFDAGHATFEIEITWRSSKFQILKFNIKSPALPR